jgi:16S rRNA (uracil1498-N3)-methyltransferase
MTARYYCRQAIVDGAATDEPFVGRTVLVDGTEAHHLAHVMRAKTGDRVTLFDGAGWEFEAQVQHVGRSDVRLTIVSGSVVNRELLCDLTLAVALPKGDRQRWLVEKAVELGVTRMVPLVTKRGVAQPVPAAVARLERTVIEASKQCGRNRLMHIETARRWNDLIDQTPPNASRLVAHPAAEDANLVGIGSVKSADVVQPAPRRIVVAVGPEGGLTDDEVGGAVGAGWRLVSLGPRILRVETAALAMVAVIAARYAAQESAD